MNENQFQEVINVAIFDDLHGQEDLIAKVLEKFDLLLNKEEYYNYQERVYKLNKAFCAISKAKNLSVSSFNETMDASSPSAQTNALGFNLENLSNLLDELIREKEPDSIEKNYLCMITSSSEDGEDDKTRIERVGSLSHRRKSLFKNLYNYELILKTYLYEKTVNDNMTQKEKKLLENFAENVTQSNFSTNNITETSRRASVCNLNNENTFLLGTPSSSKLSQDAGSSAKTANLTPMLKKSFFEDKEIKQCLNNRRRSHMDMNENLDYMNQVTHREKRRSVVDCSPHHAHSYSNKKIKPRISEEKTQPMDHISTEISPFNMQLNTKDSRLSTTCINTMEQRGSIFRDRDYFLSNIVENEEFYNNLSLDTSMKSDDEN